MVRAKDTKRKSKLPPGWVEKKLKNACVQFVNGGTPSTKDASFWTGDIPWITGADFSEQKLQIRRYITKDAVKNSSTNVVPKGWLLLVTRTGVGKMTIAPYDVAISQDLTGVQVDNRVALTNYLLVYLHFIKGKLSQLNQGTSISGITREVLLDIDVLVPPLPEQKKIALILSTWDRAIEKTEQLIAQKQQLKKGLMQQLLTGKVRFFGFSDKWRPLKLKDIGEFSKGSGISKAELIEGGIPCIRYGEIYTVHNIFIKEFHSFINEESAKLSKPIWRGDILFAGSGETAEEIGKCVAFLGNDKAYAGGDIVILRPRSEIDSLFLAFQLNNEESNRQKSSRGKGHSVVHIYPDDLRQIILKIPLLPEQKLIGEALKKADYELDKLLKRLDLLKFQKKGLMQQLLTGKVRTMIQND